MAYLQGFTNLEDNKFALLTRPVTSTSGRDWQTGGGTLDAPNKEGRTVAGGYAKRNFMTSFGQLGIATIEPVTVLPVSWLAFTGDRKGQQVLLHWSTATELNNERFDIESSSDGKQFSAVGKVPGSGNSSTVKHYQFQHFSDAKATTYFRLKQVDLDGKFEYSKVIAVKPATSPQTQLAAYPNPGQDYLYLPNLNLEPSFTWEVLDMNGNRILLPQPTLQGTTQVIEIKHLPSGNYLLQVKSKEGMQQFRFVKL
jgi:hypothetical protein